MRRTNWPRRIAAGIVIGITALAVSWVFTPREPAILAGLAGEFDAQNAELTQRVARQFPAGSPETAMRKAMLDQGFTVSAGHAKWERNEYPCRTFVDIRWDAAGGRIAATRASLFQACA
ncbi:hypothetical protein [Sphingomonas sp. G-3-2-10]|uniref:hypothetical protein n=1 Tax=Sphingomonas sp. G-3-2-10 TaxID=2728838 RepID=UPI00146E4A09|nr:hypothetical protein [Sphingomonas sp. G-3-2-10]NML07539.1 hypothetical protein [Sphingomonas sp. G-3-2-10]